jgi:hypothetical protein
MQRQPVESSMFRSIGYEPISRTLELEYNNGYVEQHSGISPEAYESLLAAPSIGKHFHQHIKPHSTGIKV